MKRLALLLVAGGLLLMAFAMPSAAQTPPHIPPPVVLPPPTLPPPALGPPTLPPIHMLRPVLPPPTIPPPVVISPPMHIPPPVVPVPPIHQPPAISPPNRPSATSAQRPNRLRFNNQSGQDAVVRIFADGSKARVAEIKVPNSAARGTAMAKGRYYIVVRYGASEKKYRYTRGDAFDMKPPPGKRLTVTITLHAVREGRYRTKKVGPRAFER